MKVRLCREFLIFNKKNNAPHLLQATFSLLVLLRGKKADSRPERSTEYYDLHLNIERLGYLKNEPFMHCAQIQCNVM